MKTQKLKSAKSLPHAFDCLGLARAHLLGAFRNPSPCSALGRDLAALTRLRRYCARAARRAGVELV